MGCDIHIVSEKRTEMGWANLGFAPFDWRSYGLFGFLAGVRNYSAVTPLSEPRGLPEGATFDKDIFEDYYGHSASWLSVKELSEFDYDAEMEDRRVTINNDGGCTCDPGGGEVMTYREFLGDSFFEDLKRLKEMGAERVVFYFDN